MRFSKKAPDLMYEALRSTDPRYRATYFPGSDRDIFVEPIHLYGLRIAHVYEDMMRDMVVVTCRAMLDGREVFVKIPMADACFQEMLLDDFELFVLKKAEQQLFAMAEAERLARAVLDFPAQSVARWLGFEDRDIAGAEWLYVGGVDDDYCELGVNVVNGWEPVFELTRTEVLRIMRELGWKPGTWPHRQPSQYGQLSDYDERLREYLLRHPNRPPVEWI